MIKRFILFLVRKRLHLKKHEMFQFSNQKTSAAYYFTNDGVMKNWNGYIEKSSVSLNWLLDDDCRIITDQSQFRCY